MHSTNPLFNKVQQKTINSELQHCALMCIILLLRTLVCQHDVAMVLAFNFKAYLPQLGLVTGNELAHIEYKYYWWNIVKQHQVIIEGWPDNIPFQNLSETSNSLSDLEDLLWRWHSGVTYWKKLSERELEALELEHDKQVLNGKVHLPAPYHCCSDYGKKHP